MSDIRMLISSCAITVTQGLRNHLTGQKQSNPPFGSPRPVMSWSTLSISGKAKLGWEQIAEVDDASAAAIAGNERGNTDGNCKRATSSTSSCSYRGRKYWAPAGDVLCAAAASWGLCGSEDKCRFRCCCETTSDCNPLRRQFASTSPA